MTYNKGKYFLVFLTLFFILFTGKIKADEPPKLVSPPDNAQTGHSLKLSWEYSGECVESGSCFLIEIDDNSDFSSPEKSTYTNNLNYSPKDLSEKTWQWRVKAKDKSGKWSSWSTINRFILTLQTNPEPSALKSGPSASPGVKQEEFFEIKSFPTQAESDEEYEISFRMKLPDKPDATFFIKAAYKKEGESNYFGLTKSGDDWIKNNEKFSKQMKITTDPDGYWEGIIRTKPDPDDSGFKDAGDYVLKIARYTQSGSGPVWSNEVKIKLVKIVPPSPSPSPEEFIEEEAIDEVDLTASIQKSALITPDIKIASVAGEAAMGNNIISEEDDVRILSERKVNWMLIVSGITVLVLGIIYAYLKIRKHNEDS
jgi:hypothetical protein